MPNWVYNSLSVNGEPDEIDRFVEQVAKPYETRHKDYETGEVERKMTEAGGLSFWNIKSPDESILDEYWETADLRTAGENNWYSWNIENWGTKWDAGEVRTERASSRHFLVDFHTAWAPPYPVMEEASRQYPTLNFSLVWEEEQGFGAEIEMNDGVLVEVRSWDIPDSHEDYVKQGKEELCVCSYEENNTHWFDDCPGKVVSIEQAVQMFEDESARL